MIPQEIITHLVKQVDTATTPKVFQQTTETVDEVIFESDIDGIRYYLVRSTQKINHQIHLSPRELAIAQLVAQGLPNKSIGNKLSISPWTVATYLRRIFNKLGVSSRTAMVTLLLEEKLISSQNLSAKIEKSFATAASTNSYPYK